MKTGVANLPLHGGRAPPWLFDRVVSFVEEPHSAICAQKKARSVLDLTAGDSRENREVTLDLVRDGPSHFMRYTKQRTLFDFSDPARVARPAELSMPRRLEVLPVDRDTYDKSISTLKEAVEGAKLEKKEKYEAIRRLGRYTAV